MICFIAAKLSEFLKYILHINLLVDIWFANIFLHLVGCSFILLIISIAVHKILVGCSPTCLFLFWLLFVVTSFHSLLVFLCVIFYRYFLWGYHGAFIKYLTVIIMCNKLKTNSIAFKSLRFNFPPYTPILGFPGGSEGKESACKVRNLSSNPGLGRSHGEVSMTTHSSILPGGFHEQGSLVGYSPWGCKESETTEHLTLSHTHTCIIDITNYLFLYCVSVTYFSSYSFIFCILTSRAKLKVINV